LANVGMNIAYGILGVWLGDTLVWLKRVPYRHTHLPLDNSGCLWITLGITYVPRGTLGYLMYDFGGILWITCG